MIVFEQNETRDDKPSKIIIGLIKDKLKLNIKTDAIEVCHRMDKKNSQQNTPSHC